MQRFTPITAVANALGVHRRTVQRWVAAGVVESVKIGGKRMVETTSLPVLGTAEQAQYVRKEVRAADAVAQLRTEYGLRF